MDSTKASNYANIGTFCLTIVILVLMVIPPLRNADPNHSVESPRRGAVIAWIMPSLLALAVLGAGALNFAASRRRQITDLGEVDDAETDNTDYRQLFLDEQISREKYQDQFVNVREERDQLKRELDEIRKALPDTGVKDSDPQITIRLVDDRFVSMSKDDYAYFEFVNGGQSDAMFACMERFQIGDLGYRVKPLKTGYAIPPDHSSKSIYFEIEKAANAPKLDIFDAFYAEWDALKRPQLDHLKVILRATYQDGARNLFETRCELVFYPGAYFRKIAGSKVIETRNHKIRRVAVAITPVDWT
jgi:hypothetical protein